MLILLHVLKRNVLNMYTLLIEETFLPYKRLFKN